MNFFIKNARFRSLMSIFTDENATKDAIIQAGKEALLLFYPLKEDKLDTLRYTMFYKKCSTSKKAIEAKELSPTSSAFLNHSCRVFFQVQCWKRDICHLNPTDWGWSTSNVNNVLFGKTTDGLLIPECLRKIIRCNCETGCSSNAQLCNCVKNVIECSPACGSGAVVKRVEHISTIVLVNI